jgi:hypothetical protein
MRRLRLCGIVAVALMTPAAARAAAGLSDIMMTEACWVRAPYALVKCQSEGGRYPARVVRARPMTPDEDSSWSLVPAGYGGIVPLDTVANDVDRVALTGRFLVARQRSGRAVVVDLDAPNAEPVEFATVDAANGFLAGQGVPAVGEAEFRSFESVYREYRPRPSAVRVLVPLAGVTLLVGGVAVLWVRRRRRRTALMAHRLD